MNSQKALNLSAEPNELNNEAQDRLRRLQDIGGDQKDASYLDMVGAYDLWLKLLDAAYQRIRDIHADPNWYNDNSEYKKRLEEFMQIQKHIFQFKNLWGMLNDSIKGT